MKPTTESAAYEKLFRCVVNKDATIAGSEILKPAMDQALALLTPREAGILRHRFGLLNGFEHTIAETAAVTPRIDKPHEPPRPVTRERVRQIEMKALRKLRHPRRFEVLKVCVVR